MLSDSTWNLISRGLDVDVIGVERRAGFQAVVSEGVLCPASEVVDIESKYLVNLATDPSREGKASLDLFFDRLVDLAPTSWHCQIRAWWLDLSRPWALHANALNDPYRCAVASNPHAVGLAVRFAQILMYQGRPKEAVQMIDEASRRASVQLVRVPVYLSIHRAVALVLIELALPRGVSLPEFQRDPSRLRRVEDICIDLSAESDHLRLASTCLLAISLLECGNEAAAYRGKELLTSLAGRGEEPSGLTSEAAWVARQLSDPRSAQKSEERELPVWLEPLRPLFWKLAHMSADGGGRPRKTVYGALAGCLPP